jgi:hypothetical protein
VFCPFYVVGFVIRGGSCEAADSQLLAFLQGVTRGGCLLSISLSLTGIVHVSVMTCGGRAPGAFRQRCLCRKTRVLANAATRQLSCDKPLEPAKAGTPTLSEQTLSLRECGSGIVQGRVTESMRVTWHVANWQSRTHIASQGCGTEAFTAQNRVCHTRHAAWRTRCPGLLPWLPRS